MDNALGKHFDDFDGEDTFFWNIGLFYVVWQMDTNLTEPLLASEMVLKRGYI